MKGRDILKAASVGIRLARPLTLLAPLIVGIMGPMAFSRWLGGTADAFLIWQISSTLVGLNVASNYLNQAMEVEIDRLNKPYRPLPRGEADPVLVAEISGLLYGLLFARAYIAFGRLSGTLALVIGLLTIAYSLPGINLKARLPYNILSQALARGLLAPLFIWTSVGGGITDGRIYAFSAVPLVFLLGASSIKDFSDVQGDLAHGVRTLPVVLGRKKAAGVVMFLIFLSHMIWITLTGLGQLPEKALPVAIAMMAISSLMLLDLPKVPRRSRRLRIENSFSWLIMYLWLIVYYLSIGLTY